MNQTIRIIGGRYRGKKLTFPSCQDLRPTTDPIRETLFNWLMHDIRGARCLDAFAGSGALGFEAFSRGASSVLLVEYAHTPYLNLKKIVEAFNANHLTVRRDNVLRFLEETDAIFDIVFLDPPFANNDWLACLTILSRRNVLRPGGLVYLESPHPIPVPDQDWEIMKSKKTGHVFYALYQKRISNLG